MSADVVCACGDPECPALGHPPVPVGDETEALAWEPCPVCGCPGEQYDGHVCEEYFQARVAELEAREEASQATREITTALYEALNGIFVEELNGRLCALPETLPDPFGEDGETDRESRCCESCARHWRRTKDALRAYDAHSAAERRADSGEAGS